MAYPEIDQLPEPPQRGEAQSDFVDKANAFTGALPDFRDQANAAGEYVEQKASEVESNADSASSSASTASDAADTATSARDDAQSARDDAQAVRDELWALYQGVQSSDPTQDKNGDPISEGAWYINSGSNQLRVYQGGAWETYVTPNYSVGTADGDLPRNDEVITNESGDPAGYRMRSVSGCLAMEEI